MMSSQAEESKKTAEPSLSMDSNRAMRSDRSSFGLRNIGVSARLVLRKGKVTKKEGRAGYFPRVIYQQSPRGGVRIRSLSDKSRLTGEFKQIKSGLIAIWGIFA